MLKDNPTQKVKIDSEQASAIFRVVLRILDKWSATIDERLSLLGLKRANYYNLAEKAKSGRPINLDSDKLERLSYILNIEQALKMVFSNPENINNFMRLENNNVYFNGATPMETATRGGFSGLYETYKRIDSMRSGGW